MRSIGHARRRAGAALVTVLVLSGGLGVLDEGVGHASVPAQGQALIASAVPSASTPNVENGSVKALAEVNGKIVAGGSFTSVKSARSTVPLTRNFLMAFDAETGVVDPAFVPIVDGEVDAIVPSADGASVYVGGMFLNANGVRSKSLARVNLTNGASTPGFVPPALNGIVNDLRLVGNRLYLGGTFTLFGGIVPHAGLASLNATTGAADPFMNLQVSGHHNWRPGSTGAMAAVGVNKLDVSPDGQRMVVVGNFTSVSGFARDQIVMVDLTGSAAAVNADWATLAYTPPCFSGPYDSYMRAIQFSPDGSYFVVVTTGGYVTASFSACDAAARWESGATGTNVLPTWIDQTGTDSLYSLAVTGTAVYVGGHQRWMNNPYGGDNARQGAVPRPGIAALDPLNGVPLSWNPGRNPRGHGAEALLATPSALWVGSDTDFIGDEAYFRPRIAKFPLAGGTANPAVSPAVLPARIYSAGPIAPPTPPDADALSARSYNGTVAGPPAPLAGSGIAWGQVRAAFMTNTTLWYGMVDGTLHRRSFDGTTFGPDALVDPYNDPVWSDVLTRSGSSTYRGLKSGLYAQMPSVTGAFFAAGRIYYTLSGDAKLKTRAFSPESGILGFESDADVSINWSTTSGMFLAGGNVYYGSTDGKLRRVAFVAGRPSGSPVEVSGPTIDGNTWRSRAMFALPLPTAPASVTGVAGDTAVTLNWTTPSAPGLGITGYVVTPYVGGVARTPVTFASTATAQTVSGLTNGQTYTFTVAALSSAGPGPASPASGPVTPANPAAANQRFITAAFVDFLSRSPTADELTFWTIALDGGTSRLQLVQNLASSTEWLTVIVNDLYLDTLGRAGDAGGLAFWIDEIRSGRETVATTAGKFYASTEYFNGQGGGTISTWVTDLYEKILHRAPDAGGLAYWTGRAQANGRLDVSSAFYQSGESRLDRVSKLYQQLLGRLPDVGGAQYWSGRILTRGDVALAADLASSSEYYTRAQGRFPELRHGGSVMNVTVVGGGSWGTTIASLLAGRAATTLWAREPEVVTAVNERHENTLFLSGFALDPALRATDDLEDALADADVVVLGVPSEHFRSVLEAARAFVPAAASLVSLTKGIEPATCRRMSEVTVEVLGCEPEAVAVLAGPNLAREVLAGQPAATVIACADQVRAKRLQRLFMTDTVRVYTNPDVIGCEIGGAVKNVIAIATGAADGLGYGWNTKAALVTRGLAELARLGVALGGHPLTFLGLAGNGDLMATCSSVDSRNHHVGEQLGRGRPLEEILDEMHMVAEGVKTTPAVLELAGRSGIEMPIASTVAAVLDGRRSPSDAVIDLMQRPPKAELHDLTSG